jgi:hypothetical protein
MLVGAHDGGIDDQVFEVRIFYQRIENTLPNASWPIGGNAGTRCSSCRTPPADRAMVRRSERPRAPHRRTDVVLAVPSFVSVFTWSKLLDAAPLRARRVFHAKVAAVPRKYVAKRLCCSGGVFRGCGTLLTYLQIIHIQPVFLANKAHLVGKGPPSLVYCNDRPRRIQYSSMCGQSIKGGAGDARGLLPVQRKMPSMKSICSLR